MTNKMEILEQIDRKINQEFKTYNVEYPLFLSCLPLVNKIFLLNSTFKRDRYDENKTKLVELLYFCQGDKNNAFIEKLLGHIKEIHSVLEEIL